MLLARSDEPCFECALIRCECFPRSTRITYLSSTTTIKREINLDELSSDALLQASTSLASFELEESKPNLYQPQKPLDPSNHYHLSNFSAFKSTTDDEKCRMRKRKRERRAFAEVTGSRKKFRPDVLVVSPTELDIPGVTIPKGRRAGLQGVKIDQKVVPSNATRLLPLSNLSKSINVKREESLESLRASSFHSDLSYSSSTFDENSTASRSSSPTSSTFSPSPSENQRTQIELNLIQGDSRLSNFTFSHRTNIGTATSYVDKSRRSFATRIESCSTSTLSDELSEDVKLATSGNKKLKKSKVDENRGRHEVRQVGLHREGGARLGYSQDFRLGLEKWTKLLRGKGMEKAKNFAARSLKIHYREIYNYHKSLAKSLSQLDLHFLFGAFPSICINSGGKVSCKPHRDQHNLGPGLCGVLPFGTFDSSRSAWIVLWEAQLCVEVGAGDIFLFPTVHKDDERNSLAFWAGASLFLWQKCGMKSLNELEPEEQKEMYSSIVADWTKAWERFPIL